MSNKSGFLVLDRLAQRITDEGILAPLWPQSESIALIDQTKLPFERTVIEIRTADEMAEAIRTMQIRGSGAIGCAGAMGAYLSVRNAPQFADRWDGAVQSLRQARPTAVALKLAVDEVLAAAREATEPVEAAAAAAAWPARRRVSGLTRAGKSRSWERRQGICGARSSRWSEPESERMPC